MNISANRAKIVGGIVVVLVVLIVVISVLATVLGGSSDTATDISVKVTDNSINLFTFPFRVSLDVEEPDHKKDDGDITCQLKVEWDFSEKKLSLRQTETYTSHPTSNNTDFITYFTFADNKATFSVSADDVLLSYCIDDVLPAIWIGVFRNILLIDNEVTRVVSQHCTGTNWVMTTSGKTISICMDGTELVYVLYQDTKGIVSQWSRNSTQTIHNPSRVENGPCSTVLLNYSMTCNISQPEPLKKKRDVPQVICLFVHGAGEKPDVTDNGYFDVNKFKDYWGDIHEYTTECASHRFIHYDSRTNGWDEEQLHINFCNFAATNGVIRNKVIFSHSMGNLVIAAALHQKKCTLDKTTSRWYSVQGPWRGSKVANTLVSYCDSTFLPSKPIRAILKYLNYCSNNKANQAYKTLTTTYNSPSGISHDDLVDVGKRNVDGVMCGLSAGGLVKDITNSAMLKMIQSISDLEKPNDGMVSFGSCSVTGTFDSLYNMSYYKGDFNHEDGTCRNGEPRRRCSKHNPCKWFHYMH